MLPLMFRSVRIGINPCDSGASGPQRVHLVIVPYVVYDQNSSKPTTRYTFRILNRIEK